MIRLEVMNRVCPRCGNGNWMRRIVGDKSDDIGRLNVKCLNCLSYFNEDDLSGVVSIKTNADRIRAMSDKELAEILHNAGGNWYSEEYWLKWLKQEAADKDSVK